MEILTASTSPLTSAKKYKVAESFLLKGEELEKQPVKRGDVLYLAPPSMLGPEPQGSDPKPEEKGDKPLSIKDLKGIGAGGSVATGAMKLFRLGNTTTKAELTKVLTEYNVAPTAAESMADTILDFAKTHLAKTVFLSVAGGAATIGIVELFRPSWSWGKKIAAGGVAAVAFAAAYLVLVWAGVLT